MPPHLLPRPPDRQKVNVSVWEKTERDFCWGKNLISDLISPCLFPDNMLHWEKLQGTRAFQVSALQPREVLREALLHFQAIRVKVGTRAQLGEKTTRHGPSFSTLSVNRLPTATMKRHQRRSKILPPWSEIIYCVNYMQNSRVVSSQEIHHLH